MPKFTPGPWEIQDRRGKTRGGIYIVGPKYEKICRIGVIVNSIPDHDARLIARLIAKAPPMYALLRILAEAFSESGEYPYMEKTIKDLLAEIDGE